MNDIIDVALSEKTDYCFKTLGERLPLSLVHLV